MESLALLLDQGYKRHVTPHGHPERQARYDAVSAALDEASIPDRALRIEPRAATVDELTLVHELDYVRLVEREITAGARHLSTGDTHVSSESYQVALDAVGGVLNAIDAVMQGQAHRAFCAVRPPGHHARPAQGMGFCIFNNIAIAARHAQRAHGAERVLIADWDVHHGNGTQDTFYDDGSVFFMSTHQSPWYPGTGPESETGQGAGKGTTLNCPLPAGSGRNEILGAFRDQLLPLARDFSPDLVLVSAGFDSRAGDPLGDFRLDDDDFRELTDLMLEIADTTAEGRLVSVLEGGYSLDGLAKASAAHATRLVEQPA